MRKGALARAGSVRAAGTSCARKPSYTGELGDTILYVQPIVRSAGTRGHA